MKVLHSVLSSLGAGLCCFALVAAEDAAARAGGRMRSAPFHVPLPAARHVQGHPPRVALRHEHFHRRHHGFEQVFVWSYGPPYYSGTFETWPPAEQELGGPPEFYPPPFYYPPPVAEAPPPPCVTPLLIELRRPNTHRHLPRVVYGAPNSCPPPLIAKAH